MPLFDQHAEMQRRDLPAAAAAADVVPLSKICMRDVNTQQVSGVR
jgi:hypothetical protein